ncbi:hypothetical protein DYB36_007795 [Aphanomyces astaci]|uniref:histidine--tRNA ligase n=2 Tax=Aphanomyces astaci TaxID=112090 RepID=A0A397AC73_APHAT|nr:hypothetical protein DYB36_007795 [Aphanomyces astaci]
MATKKATGVAAVRGTRDLWAKDLAAQQHVVSIMQSTCSRYGYSPVQTPMIESTDLYMRSLGTTSDIVSKEMYTFPDNSNNSLTLRPEGTAGIEYLGSNGPHIDIDVLAMANDVVNALGLDLTLHINTLGCVDSRKAYRSTLTAFLDPLKHELSADSQQRVLRILDSKDSRDKELLQDAPRLLDSLTKGARTVHCHTVFEFVDSSSGLACLAGGCYDHLVEALGGPAMSCVGWAAGVDRLTALGPVRPPPPTQIAMIPVGNAGVSAIQLAAALRQAGHFVHWIEFPQLKKQLKLADQFGCTYAILLGQDELDQGYVTLKDLGGRTQQTLPAENVVAYFDQLLA